MSRQSRPVNHTPRGKAAAPAVAAASARSTLLLGLGIVAGIGVAVALIFALVQTMRGPTAPALASVEECRGFPQFTTSPEYGFRGGVVASTSIPERMGLVLLDPLRGSSQGFQHPNGTWDDAGWLGPFVSDEAGNIYAGPVPRTSLVENPPEGANTLWVLETTTGVFTPYLQLEPATPPNERNPFGLMGLTFDCETDQVYASSVAGSGPASEMGRLSRINVTDKATATVQEGVDAMGLAVVKVGEEKRLFYGLARLGEVWSVALDQSGAAVGEPRREFALGDLGGEDDRVLRIDVEEEENALRILTVPFAFTLQARSETLQQGYLARPSADGTWTLERIAPASQ
jgi:hypothetical protein